MNDYNEVIECLEKLGKYELKQDCLVEDLIVYEPIKQAILELKQIKEANPSEALERLENNKNAIPYAIDYRVIKQALIKSQENEKKNTKYKQLEEQLGCSLDVVKQLFSQDFIYFKYLGNVQTMKVKVCKGLSYGSKLGWSFTCIYANLDFIYVSLKDYKKTWWLKEDRSE